jgi:glutaredoxin
MVRAAVVVYSKDHCPYCEKAKHLLDSMKVKYDVKKIGVDVTREELLEIAPNARTAPQIIINSQVIGGYEQLVEYVENTGFNGTGYGAGT